MNSITIFIEREDIKNFKNLSMVDYYPSRCGIASAIEVKLDLNNVHIDEKYVTLIKK